jgi:hypothetical protein
MASTSHGFLSWVGYGFNPGVEHYWWSSPADYGSVVSITAHSVQLAGVEREIAVKDVRTHVDASGNRIMLFTVRNTGTTNIPGYGLGIGTVRA